MSDAKLIISVEDDGGAGPSDTAPSSSFSPPGAAESRSPGGDFSITDAASKAADSLQQFAEALSSVTANILSSPAAVALVPREESAADSPVIENLTEGAADAPSPPQGGGESMETPEGVEEFGQAVGRDGLAGIASEAGEKFNEFNTAIEKATAGMLGMPMRIMMQTAMRGIANAGIDAFMKMSGMKKEKGESGPLDVRVVNFSEIGGRVESPEGGEAEPPGEKKEEPEAPKAEGRKPEEGKREESDGRADAPRMGIVEKAKDFGARAKEKGRELLEKGKEKAADLKERGQSFLDQLRERGQRGKGRVAKPAGNVGMSARNVGARVGTATRGAVASGGRLAGVGAARALPIVGAAAGTAASAVGGAVSGFGAATGLTKIAAVALPAAAAIGGLAAVTIGLKKSWELFDKFLGEEVERLKRTSIDVAIQSSVSQMRRDMEMIRRGERIGTEVAEFESTRSGFEIEGMRLMTEVKGILGDLFEVTQPAFESGVSLLRILADVAKATKDATEKAADKGKQAVDLAMLSKSSDYRLFRLIQEAYEWWRGKEEEDDPDHVWYTRLMDHAKDLGIDAKNLPPVIPPAPPPPQQPGQNP